MIRIGLCLALLGLIAAGCSSRPASTSNTPARPAPIPVAANPGLIVTPGGTVAGRVALVNARARFVVLSYPMGAVPPVGKQLHIYRNGLKVGEVRVTGPVMDINTSADIIAGECEQGDVAQEN
jgi:hypothetical protein